MAEVHPWNHLNLAEAALDLAVLNLLNQHPLLKPKLNYVTKIVLLQFPSNEKNCKNVFWPISLVSGKAKGWFEVMVEKSVSLINSMYSSFIIIDPSCPLSVLWLCQSNISISVIYQQHKNISITLSNLRMTFLSFLH